jgi:hypothetical protein
VRLLHCSRVKSERNDRFILGFGLGLGSASYSAMHHPKILSVNPASMQGPQKSSLFSRAGICLNSDSLSASKFKILMLFLIPCMDQVPKSKVVLPSKLRTAPV